MVAALVVLLCCAGGVLAVLTDRPHGRFSPVASPGGSAVMSGTPSAARSPLPASSTPVVVMPNLVGMNAAAAVGVLQRAGFTRVDLGSVDKNETVVLISANWRVVDQSVPAGTPTPTTTLIILGCTKQR